MKVEDITVEGNTVTAINISENGKTATVTLGAALVPDTEYKVTVKTGEDASTDYTVKFNLAVTAVAVDAKSYDNDTEDQFVSFKINGVTGNVNDLLVNGYTVSFAATKTTAGTTSDATSELFASTTTGLLNTNLVAGTNYKVQLTVSRGSDVFVSEQAEIQIKNVELVASSIESFELTNTTAGIIQKSNTFVVADTVTITELVAMQNGTKTTLAAADVLTALGNGTLEVKTSNAAVVSFNKATGTLTANTPGTATVTITYGTVTKTLNLTVAQETRKVTKATPKSTSLTTILSPVTNNTVDFEIFDQYGDPVNASTLTVESSNTTVATAAVNASNNKGKATLTVTPTALGNTSIIFKNSDGKTVGSVAVKVTDNATSAKSVFEIIKPSATEIAAGQSEDATIDKATELNVKFKLQPYTAENVKLSAVDLQGYRFVFDKDVVAVDGDASGDYTAPATALTELSITASGTANAKLGYSDIAVYNTTGKLVGIIRVNVVNNTPALNAVTFKSVPEVTFAGKKISYKELLETTSVTGDDIVKGITLTSTANSVVRIVETAGATAGSLYLDKNGDATYTAGTDTLLGKVTMSVVSGSTGLAGFTDIITGSTTVAGDEGTIIVTVTNNDSTPKIISSTSISVKVPN